MWVRYAAQQSRQVVVMEVGRLTRLHGTIARQAMTAIKKGAAE